MKVILTLVMIASAGAFACPDLSGVYGRCLDPAGGGNTSSDLRITQSEVAGVTSYDISFVNDSTGQRQQVVYVADGLARVTTQPGPTPDTTLTTVMRVSCQGDTVQIVNDLTWNDSPFGHLVTEMDRHGGDLSQRLEGTIFGNRAAYGLLCN